MKARAMFHRIAPRLREPSSLAGLSALAVLFGVPVGLSEAVSQVIGGILAVAAVLLPEGRAPSALQPANEAPQPARREPRRES